MNGVIKEMQSLKDIIDRVFNVDMAMATRKRDYVYSKMVFSKIMRDRGCRLEVIGSFIKRDHATIVYYTKIIDSLFNQDGILLSRYLECKNCFYENRQPGVYLTTEKNLQDKLAKLQKDYDNLLAEKQRLVDGKQKVDRLENIIKIINFNTPYGQEEEVEKKIIRMFNLK